MMKPLLLCAAVLLSACDAPAPTAPVAPPTASTPDTPPPAPQPAPPVATAPAFADKVWAVSASSSVEVGSTYSFLSDGTLVVDSPNGTPLHGSWTYRDGALTMIEEGQSYPTDIVRQDADTLQIRSHNPGGVVDITLVPAPGVPLPVAPAH